MSTAPPRSLVILTFESLGLPLPGESLPHSCHRFSRDAENCRSRLLMLAAWAGAAWMGRPILAIDRKAAWPHPNRINATGAKIGITADRLTQVEAGLRAIWFCHRRFRQGFVNVLRQLNGVVAGMLKMDWRAFSFSTRSEAPLWVSAWTLTGFILVRTSPTSKAVCP